MSDAVESLLKRALSLDENDRASIAGALIESLHGEPEAGIDEAWELEIERRVAELDARSVETVPWPAVRDRLFRGFE
jgi:putative addiction module component (TIGR02574 family)